MTKNLTQPPSHTLDTFPEAFEAIHRGHKAFELRKNDRIFQVGDIVVLAEFNPKKHEFTRRTVVKQVSYILSNAPGLAEGYVVLGLQEFDPDFEIVNYY